MSIELEHNEPTNRKGSKSKLQDDEFFIPEDDIELHKLNEEIENKCFSRSEVIGNLKFPQSSAKRLIVLPNEQGIGFRNDSYDSSMLGHILSKAEFCDIVYEFTRICCQQWSLKLNREQNDPFKFEKKMLLWNIPIFIIAIILFSLRVFDAVVDNYTFEIGLALFGIDIAAVMLNFYKSQVRKPDLTSFQEATYNSLLVAIKKINERFVSKKIVWTLHPKFYWIEIHFL